MDVCRSEELNFSEDRKDSIITLNDFPFICRICSLRRNDLRLFKEEGYLWDLFLTIRNIDVDAASIFPKNICDECINKLQDILVFIDLSKSKYSTSAENFIPKGKMEYSEAVESGVSRGDGVRIEEYQVCRICSCHSNLTPFTEKINLMQIFQNITKIDVKINSANGNLICNVCIGKLEDIASLTELASCNDRKFQYCISKNEAVKTESYTNLSGITHNDTILNNIHDGHEEKHEIIDIKNEDLTIHNGFKLETTIDETNGEYDIDNVKEEIIDSDSGEKPHSYISTDKSPFKCNQCNESFVRRTHWRRHMDIHTGDKPFKCDYCHKGFARKDHLQRHSRIHNNIRDKQDNPHKCDCCGKSFPRIERLKRHLLVHIRKKSFNCEYCGECFPREVDLQRHSIIHSTGTIIDGPKEETVDTDAESFPGRNQQNGLENHLQTFPNEPSIQEFHSFPQTENEESPCIGTDAEPFSCNQCKKSFAEQSSLSDHLLTHTREKPFTCYSCGKSFVQKRSLRHHLLTHTTEKSFKCDCCDRSFFDLSALKRHYRTHTTDKPFRCDCCYRGFNEKSDLEKHFRNHTEEKPYSCEGCDKKFFRERQLQRHMLTHSAEKPFKCDFCVKSFIESSDLKRHLRLHTGEKPYKCNHCDERFTRNDHLTRHLLSHAAKKPFECNCCDRSFTLRHHFEQHLLVHSEEKSYQCGACGRSFKRKQHLRQHVLIHSRKMLMKCDQCDKYFAGNRYLQQHLRTHVIENPPVLVV